MNKAKFVKLLVSKQKLGNLYGKALKITEPFPQVDFTIMNIKETVKYINDGMKKIELSEIKFDDQSPRELLLQNFDNINDIEDYNVEIENGDIYLIKRIITKIKIL